MKTFKCSSCGAYVQETTFTGGGMCLSCGLKVASKPLTSPVRSEGALGRDLEDTCLPAAQRDIRPTVVRDSNGQVVPEKCSLCGYTHQPWVRGGFSGGRNRGE